MASAPTVSIGLPVYNGERFLRQSLDALLAQTFTDFELIISDNASTDGTAAICDEYANLDSRIRYIRQPSNLGAGPNHNLLPKLSRAPYFKWASHDDLYDPDLLQFCVGAIEQHPDAALVHCLDARMDAEGRVLEERDYTLNTSAASPVERLRSLLYGSDGDDFYGVIRSDILRRVDPHGSYFNADRAFVASLALHGPFHQVRKVLYYRREHSARLSRSSVRQECAGLDPRRADRLRHPAIRLYGEYPLGYLRAVRRAPLSTTERRQCNATVLAWMSSKLVAAAQTRRLRNPVP